MGESLFGLEEGFKSFLDCAWISPGSFVTMVDVGRSWHHDSIKGLTKTMLVFGRHAGYFTRDQAELMDGISWTPPRGYQTPSFSSTCAITPRVEGAR